MHAPVEEKMFPCRLVGVQFYVSFHSPAQGLYFTIKRSPQICGLAN